MVALGVTSIRLDLAWDDIQPDSPTSYDWTNFDRIVQAANARGITLLPTLAYTPAWARPAGCSDKCPPTDPAQFEAFVSAAVQRYAPQGIHTWEIWNEPNTSGFFQPAPDIANVCEPSLRCPQCDQVRGSIGNDPSWRTCCSTNG